MQGDKIIALDTNPVEISFAFLKTSSKYVISYKDYSPTIKLFHYSNFSGAEIEVNGARMNKIVIEKSIMMLDNTVYDLDVSLSSKGWFYRDPTPING